MTQRPTLHDAARSVDVGVPGRCVMDGCYGECRESDSFCDSCLYSLRWGAA